MKKLFRVLLFVSILMLMFIPLFTVGAQEEIPPLVPVDAFANLPAFFSWLVTPLGICAASWFISFLLDKWRWWADKIPHDIKILIVVLLAGLLAYGVSLMNNLPALVNDPLLNTFFLGLVAFFTTQKQHARFEAAAKTAEKIV